MNYRKWSLFATAIVFYLGFRAVRHELPDGVFSRSFPSVLFIPVALHAVDIVHVLIGKSRQWSESLPVIVVTSLISVALFEGIAPLVTSRASGDLWDCVGLVSGGAIYSSVLREKMEYDLRRDPGRHAHIWLGAYLKNSELQVFRNWRVEPFEAPKGSSFYFGADWGYSIDPSVLIRCFISGTTLFIDYEAYEIGCEIVRLPELFAKVPESDKWPVVADSARPETINYMNTHGFPLVSGSVKGAKSVEDGVEFIRSFDIVVHPRCTHTKDEFSLYSFKADQLGRPTNVIADKHNHLMDAIRYGVYTKYKNRSDFFVV